MGVIKPKGEGQPKYTELSKTEKAGAKHDGDNNSDHMEAGEYEEKSGLVLTTFNMCVSMIGTGFIGMPFAFKEGGIGFGILYLVVAALITDFSVNLLARAARMANKKTYWATMKTAFGKPGLVFLAISLLLYPLAMLVSTSMVIADNISQLLIRITHIDDIDDLRSHIWGRREMLLLFVFAGAFVPLSLYRNVVALAKWSILFLVIIIVMVILVTVRYATLDLPSEPGSYKFIRFDVVQAIGIITSSYICQDVSLLLYQSMKNPTERRWNEATHISLAIAMVVYLSVGILGYATFTENTQGNILQNYCSDDDVINAGRFLYILGIILTFPFGMFVIRNLLEMIFFSKDQPPPLWRHIIFTLLIASVIYGISLITECLGVVFIVAGLILGLPLGMIFPPLMVLKLSPMQFWHYKNIPLFILLLAAFGVMGLGIYETIREIAEGEMTCPEGQEAAFCF